MSDSFFEQSFLFLLENSSQFQPQIVDIMCMLPGFVSKIHGIIGEEYTECECYREEYAAETIVQSHQHSDAACQSAMEGRKSSWSEDMTHIKTLISDQIYDYLDYLDDTSHDDNDKNRVHMEPVGKKVLETGDDELYHQKYDIRSKSLCM